MGNIIIDKPYIVEDGAYVRLCAKISTPMMEEKILYYELEHKYAPYLCFEKGDAFLCALIVKGMEEGWNIEVRSPISTDLYYQLVNYYIPILADNTNDLNMIKVLADTTEVTYDANAVLTGLSGGVDSFYSVAKHLKLGLPKRKLTHGLFCNIATLDNSEDRIRAWFDERKLLMKDVAEQLGIEYISLYTNIYDFYSFPYTTYGYYFTPLYASNAYALQKLCGVYYFSSGFTINDFEVRDASDNACFDLFNLKCLSSKGLVFYSSGIERTRMEKLRYMKDCDANGVIENYLSICAQEVTGRGFKKGEKLNCGVCNKCMRTVGELYAVDSLEKYADIIQLAPFYKNKGKYLAKMYYMNSKAFSEEIIRELKNVHKLPKNYLFWKILLNPIYSLKSLRVLRSSSLVRKIYYRFNLDILLNGFRPYTDDGENWKEVVKK